MNLLKAGILIAILFIILPPKIVFALLAIIIAVAVLFSLGAAFKDDFINLLNERRKDGEK